MIEEKVKLNIIIFNGNLQPSTFILNMLKSIKNENRVILAGAADSFFPFSQDGIKYVSTGSNKNSANFIFRTLSIWLGCLYKRPGEALMSLLQFIRSGRFNKKKIIRFNYENFLLFYAPDVLHIQWASHLIDFEFLFKNSRVKKPKVIVSLRGRLVNVLPIVNPQIAGFYRQIFPEVHGFHAVSKAIANEAIKYGAKSDLIQVIYSGIDIKKTSLYQKEGYKKEKTFKLLSVGRHHWKKGYSYALDAVNELLTEGYNISYTIIASGKTPESLLFQMYDSNLSRNVNFLGEMNQQDIFSYMQQSDALLLSSLEEGIANVVLEAMAIGLPVISSDCGGMNEAIRHLDTGFLFKRRSREDMKSKILQCIEASPEFLNEIAKNGRSYIESNHTILNLGNRMTKLYEE